MDKEYDWSRGAEGFADFLDAIPEREARFTAASTAIKGEHSLALYQSDSFYKWLEVNEHWLDEAFHATNQEGA